MITESNIQLTVFQDEDVALFTKWLEKDYIYKWFCCNGFEKFKDGDYRKRLN